MLQRSPTKPKSRAGVYLILALLGVATVLVAPKLINGHEFNFGHSPQSEKADTSHEDDPKRPIFGAVFTGDATRKAGDAVTVSMTINGATGRAMLLYKKSWLSAPITKRPGLTIVLRAESKNPTELIECTLYTSNKAGMFIILDHDERDGPGHVECSYEYQPG